jgi:LDH2 family malate/lactate/ureidoglycolate dehydrogenase
MHAVNRIPPGTGTLMSENTLRPEKMLIPSRRLPAGHLEALAANLFAGAGMEEGKAQCMAHLLLLTDRMGRPTHGLAQAAAYLDQIEKGLMTTSGEPEIIRDTGSTFVWDGRYLPGLWLMDQAIEIALSRVAEHGVVTFACSKSHHIGCLAALAKKAADRGCYAMLASSGPHTRIVAPYGGKEGLFSPNPFAFAFPTSAFPVLIDTCASITTLSLTREKAAAGIEFDQPWLLDHEGRPSRDPTIVERATEKGSLMLLGGEDSGHKGFGLALMVEALTQGLSGHGRRDAPTRWGASIYMQIIDPEAFAGREAFIEQMDFFADRCHANAPIDPAHPVRLPGEQANRRIAEADALGVPVSPETMAALTQWAQRLGVPNTVF